MVEEAASRLAPLASEPANYFSAEQRDTLTAIGLDLRPMRESDVDPRAAAVAQTAVLRDSALTVAEAATRLGVDPSRVRHRLAQRRLTGWKDGTGWLLPAWQFADDRALPGLAAVLAALPDDQPPLVVAAFMTTPQPDLQLATPRQWLATGGDPSRVARLAATLGTPA